MSEPIYGPWQRAAWVMPHRILAPPVGEALPVVEVDWNTSAVSEPDWRSDYDPTVQELAAELVRVVAERDGTERALKTAREQRDLAEGHWHALGKALLRLYSLAIPNLAMNSADHMAIRDALRDAGLLPGEES